MFELWQSFQTEYHYGEKNYEDRNDGNYPSMLTWLGILKQ